MLAPDNATRGLYLLPMLALLGLAGLLARRDTLGLKRKRHMKGHKISLMTAILMNINIMVGSGILIGPGLMAALLEMPVS